MQDKAYLTDLKKKKKVSQTVLLESELYIFMQRGTGSHNEPSGEVKNGSCLHCRNKLYLHFCSDLVQKNNSISGHLGFSYTSRSQ